MSARDAGGVLTRTLAVGVATGLSGALVGLAVAGVAPHRTAPWLLGRAAGVTAYLLLVGLVLLGLVLSHPWRTRWRRPAAAARLRLHVSLAVFTLVFTLLHIVALATDHYAGVGWRGALLPFGAEYRPLPVTLGLLGLWSGVAAGLTAALAGRGAGRVWLPVHRVAAASLLLVWLHGVLAGSDSAALRSLYLGTGALVLLLALTRYAVRTPADRVTQLRRELDLAVSGRASRR